MYEPNKQSKQGKIMGIVQRMMFKFMSIVASALYKIEWYLTYSQSYERVLNWKYICPMKPTHTISYNPLC